jgi:hypothetical protein
MVGRPSVDLLAVRDLLEGLDVTRNDGVRIPAIWWHLGNREPGIWMVGRHGDRMVDGDYSGRSWDLFDHQPQQALAMQQIEGFANIVDLGQETLEALGEGDVGVSTQQLGVECGELALDGHLAIAERCQRVRTS